MWKIAIAVMLLATSAFGAVSITVNELQQAPKPGTNEVTFTFHLNNDGANVAGYTITVADVTTGAKALLKTGTSAAGVREVLDDQGVLTDPTTANSAITNRLLSAIPGDLGFTSFDNTSAWKTNSGDLVKYTFFLPGGAPTAGNNIQVKFNCSASLMTGFDGDGFPILSSGAVVPTICTITPEPASMLLLAAGAAFFARRRRA